MLPLLSRSSRIMRWEETKTQVAPPSCSVNLSHQTLYIWSKTEKETGKGEYISPYFCERERRWLPGLGGN